MMGNEVDLDKESSENKILYNIYMYMKYLKKKLRLYSMNKHWFINGYSEIKYKNYQR